MKLGRTRENSIHSEEDQWGVRMVTPQGTSLPLWLSHNHWNLPGSVASFCTSARRVRLTSLPHPASHQVPLILAQTQGFNYQAGCSEAARC